ncbi:endonuclease/exonuclease/phosphatase family protein [Flexivirga alba]|uniref:Endonuclease/exonuclease/phosphatase family protein n=1 Tax=Flexivirga alba TaxID=702742 RepID=A0ABW2AHC1_9MICO
MPESRPQPRNWWRPEARTVPWWVLAVLLVLVALGVLARWLDATWLVPIVQAFFPVFGVSALVLLVAVAAMRYRWLALCALVVAIPPLALGMASVRSDTVAAGPHDEVVLTLNLQYGHANAAEVVAAARERRVDTLVLEECTPEELTALRRHGLDGVLPHQAGSAEPGIRGTVVRSNHPVTLIAAHPAGRFPSIPDVLVQTPQGAYRLRAVHTPAPLPDIVPDWRSALRSLTRWRAELPAKQPLVMAGDFNASSAMPGFRELADGLTDSSRATGSGWTRTWPRGAWLPPFIQLDHVLTRGFGVVADGTIDVSGTDHRGYWARLRFEPVTRAAAR